LNTHHKAGLQLHTNAHSASAITVILDCVANVVVLLTPAAPVHFCFLQIGAWRGAGSGEGDDELDPGEAFERMELARKAAQAGDPSSTAFFAAASKTGRMAVRSPVSGTRGV
jgi:hypothetical protein